MQYLRVSDLVKAHRAVLSPDDQLAGFDFGRLDSAASRPMMLAQYASADLHGQAAGLFWALIRDHPFATGNKRTAVIATAVFYNMNGWRMAGSDLDLFHLAQDVASETITEAEVALILASWARSLPI